MGANRPLGLPLAAGLVTIVLWLAGCGEPLSPAELVGEYPLVGFNGGTPPAVVQSQEGCTTRLDGGTLTIRNQGVIEMALDAFYDCSAVGGPAYELGITYTGTYELDGHTLDIVFYANGTISTHGEVSDEAIAVPIGLEVDPLLFAR